MAYNNTHDQMQANLQLAKQELYSLVDHSSKWLMEDEIDVARYYESFQTLADRLHFFCYISKKECNKLFWQGFHCKDRVALTPYLTNQHHVCPGADFDFRELFGLAYNFLGHRRLTAEAEAEAKAKAEAAQQWREDDQELKRLITGMWDRSRDDPTYAVLYRQCTRCFPNALQGVPKPEPLPKPMQDAPPQRSVCVRRAQPAPSSPA